VFARHAEQVCTAYSESNGLFIQNTFLVIRDNNNAHETALLVAEVAAEKKGRNIVLLDMRGLTMVCDWFVLVSAGSTRMVKAISRAIDKGLSAKKISPLNVQGRQNPHWVLMDYGNVVVHIFYSRIRDFYELEQLWSDAPREHFNSDG